MTENKWEGYVRKVVPYTPGEQPKDSDVVKLNTNENPYPPCPSVRGILDGFDISQMRLYPAPDSDVLVNAIAERYGLKSSQVFVGVGSDDVISMAFMTFFGSDKPILFPDITYSFYDVWADVYRIPYRTCPLNKDFTINPDDYKQENGGIIFPNPNAPTGVLESVEMIEDIVKSNPDSVVIIDEAYIDFAGAGKSCLPLINKYDNVLVIQTYSKSRSMAGMRIGFAMGSEKLIKYMNDVKFSINSYTMNTVTQLCGAESMKNEEYFAETVNKIVATRERSKTRLAELGFTFTDSQSNFIFASPQKKSAQYVFEELKKRRIYVRYWNKPIICDYLRITVGTDKEMDRLFTALEEILNG
ncbi:MAG: histidinol-phosphate transaminase [Ruminococcus flavefaciens]|nr:histidinol-phosphate transaminase [Ruminococcus flavefaciens]MCM1229975.1 histidinol-phosphate transaminase [Ruminococcus flavefaciens]